MEHRLRLTGASHQGGAGLCFMPCPWWRGLSDTGQSLPMSSLVESTGDYVALAALFTGIPRFLQPIWVALLQLSAPLPGVTTQPTTGCYLTRQSAQAWNWSLAHQRSTPIQSRAHRTSLKA